jgi:hypothetical protein
MIKNFQKRFKTKKNIDKFFFTFLEFDRIPNIDSTINWNIDFLYVTPTISTLRLDQGSITYKSFNETSSFILVIEKINSEFKITNILRIPHE